MVIIDTGKNTAQENMRLDRELLDGLAERPILHLYEWERESATFGYFLQPEKYLNIENARKYQLDLARRPTGGGIVFHIWDMAFSCLVPGRGQHNTLENYALINGAVLAAVEEFLNDTEKGEMTPTDGVAWDAQCSHFCMAKPTKYDVLFRGRKVAGAAQRQRKNGFLHQGTIALLFPPRTYLSDVLLEGTRVAEAMHAHTYPLVQDPAYIGDAKEALRKLLCKYLKDTL